MPTKQDFIDALAIEATSKEIKKELELMLKKKIIKIIKVRDSVIIVK